MYDVAAQAHIHLEKVMDVRPAFFELKRLQVCVLLWSVRLDQRFVNEDT